LHRDDTLRTLAFSEKFGNISINLSCDLLSVGGARNMCHVTQPGLRWRVTELAREHNLRTTNIFLGTGTMTHELEARLLVAQLRDAFVGGNFEDRLRLLNRFDTEIGWDHAASSQILRLLRNDYIARSCNSSRSRWDDDADDWMYANCPQFFLRSVLISLIENPSITWVRNRSPRHRFLEVDVGLTMSDILEALSRNKNDPLVGETLCWLLDFSKIPSIEFESAWHALPMSIQSRFASLLGESTVNQYYRYFNRALWRQKDMIGYRYIIHNWQHIQRRISRIERQFGSTVFRTREWRLNSLPHRAGRFHRVPQMPFHFASQRYGAGSPIDLDAAFVSVLGFSLDSSIVFEYTDELRFEYLLEHARMPGELRLDAFIAEFDIQPERMVAMQKSADGLRDEMAQLQYRYESLVRELEPQIDSIETRFSPQLEKMASQISEIQDRLEDEYFLLVEVSQRLIPQLSEVGITWERIETEGILGEFQPLNRTATIYSGMIRLAASSPQFSELMPTEELVDSLHQIAEIHEAAHGYLILGRNCNSEKWDDYGAASYRLHEAIAMAYTSRVLARIDCPSSVRDLFENIDQMLPVEYRVAIRLNDVSAENLRQFASKVRTKNTPTIRRRWNQVCHDLKRHDALLAVTAGDRHLYHTLQDLVQVSLDAVKEADNVTAECNACEDFFRSVGECLSSGLPVLGLLGAGPWPDADELACLAVADLCFGPSIGRGNALRLKLEWITNRLGGSADAAGIDKPNLPSLGLENYDELMEKIGEGNAEWFQILKQRTLLDSRDAK